MKKKIFTAIFLIISLLWISESIAQSGRFVRKKMQQEFFIPQKAYDKPEKLPEFYIAEPESEPMPEKQTNKKEVRKEGLAPLQPESEYLENSADIIPESAPTPNVIVITDSDLANETFYVSDYLHYIDDIDLRNLPLYKQKYDEYLADLDIISKTGKAPDRASLTADLLMMKSNLKTVVDDKFGIGDDILENYENKPENDNNI